MERKYPNLTKPITIGNVTFRNRMFSAPMGGTDITNDGCIGPKSTAFYELRAKGGAGAVTVSECMVHPKTDGSHAYHLDTSILNSLAAATYTADAIRRHGAIPSLELSHSGMYAGTYMTDKNRQYSMNQWGPSDTVRPDGVPVKALTKELIREIVEAYGKTAALAKRAGFEMLMIHGGHGWLINQFLSPYFNKRTDEYGGSLENRCRLLERVLQAVRQEWPAEKPLLVRVSAEDYLEGGIHPAEMVEIVKRIKPWADMIDVSTGGVAMAPIKVYPGYQVKAAQKIREECGIPTIAVGLIKDPQVVEEILGNGRADMVGLGREQFRNPNWVLNVARDYGVEYPWPASYEEAFEARK